MLLILAPWSRFWERNYFAGLVPVMAQWFAHPYVKGAVTGIGLVSVAAAVVEISDVIARRGAGREHTR